MAGVDACKLEVPRVNCPCDMRIYWCVSFYLSSICKISVPFECPLYHLILDSDNCKTSIVDFHRSCKKCSYDLCLSCCRQLRQGPNPGNGVTSDMVLCLAQLDGKGGLQQRNSHSKVAIQEPSNGQNDMLTDNPVPFEDCIQNSRRWTLNSNRSIPCPPKRLGGCESSLLELKCLFKEKFISDLLVSGQQ